MSSAKVIAFPPPPPRRPLRIPRRKRDTATEPANTPIPDRLQQLAAELDARCTSCPFTYSDRLCLRRGS
jgi:hypothetical protein